MFKTTTETIQKVLHKYWVKLSLNHLFMTLHAIHMSRTQCKRVQVKLYQTCTYYNTIKTNKQSINLKTKETYEKGKNQVEHEGSLQCMRIHCERGLWFCEDSTEARINIKYLSTWGLLLLEKEKDKHTHIYQPKLEILLTDSFKGER